MALCRPALSRPTIENVNTWGCRKKNIETVPGARWGDMGHAGISSNGIMYAEF